MKNINNGVEFLNLVFKDMKDSIKSESTEPSKRISEYLERLERVHGKALSDEHKKEILKSFYYDKYIIKSLPNSYVKYRKGYFHDLGLDNKEKLTDEDLEQVLVCIKQEQRKSLDNWLDYLFSKENNHPTWFKYYIFQGVTKVGTFYPTIREFTKRSASTTEPFIPVRPDVIENMYILISKYLEKKPLTPKEQEIASTGLNFRNIYSNLYTSKFDDLTKEENNYDNIEEHIGTTVSGRTRASYVDDSYLDSIPQEDDRIILPRLEPETLTKPKR